MYKQILIPVDLSHKDQAWELIEVCDRLVNNVGAILHLLYVDQSLVHRASYPHLNQANYESHRKDAERELVEIVDNLSDDLQGVSHCRQGTAHDQILEVAEELCVDAIVMMAKKPGISSYFIGSNAERVVRHAKCSVFVIRN